MPGSWCPGQRSQGSHSSVEHDGDPAQELLEALDDLRLLGNDAAHVESQVYNQVGKDEVELALDVTKEVLKSVYQYADLLNRLRALKRNP